MQARAIGETELIRGAVYLARAMAARSGQLRDFDYHYGFYGSEEHKGLGFIVSIAITQQNVVVGYLAYMTLVDATGDALDIYDLAFVAAKQIFCVLSFHFKHLPNQAIGAASSSLRSLLSDASSDH
jgi:hypothetical protein